ncbi:hypothetical protein GCM10009827_070890 [Dactylosporangium maewongense]|uniref:Peptidase C14 caspase domain-containing protein n=1 Tax=Dactylosporangium maewongense TaxID=634393 RepID=A0ABN2BLE2_9ACTN
MARLASPDDSRVVLVGNAHYAHPDISDLPTVSAGVAALAEAFTAPALGGLKTGNCQVLINPQRPGDVTGPVRRAADEAQDVLVVYFSGHGQRDPRLRGLYLQVGDTDPDDLPATAIDVQHIRSLILESRARYRILILDCCYSGAALPLMGDGDNESDLQEADGVAILSSGDANFHANPVDVEGRFTLFTGALIRAVRQGLDNGEPTLTITAVFQHLRAVLGQPRINQSGAIDRVGLFRNARYEGTVEPDQLASGGTTFRAPAELIRERMRQVAWTVTLTFACAVALSEGDRDTGIAGLVIAMIGVLVALYRLFWITTQLRITPNGIAHRSLLWDRQHSWDEILGVRLRRSRSLLLFPRYDVEIRTETTETTTTSSTITTGKDDRPTTSKSTTVKAWDTLCSLNDVDAPAAQVAHALSAAAGRKVLTVDEIDDRVKRFPAPVDRLGGRLFTIAVGALLAATVDWFTAVLVTVAVAVLFARLVFEKPWRTIGVGADGIEIAGPFRTTKYPWAGMRYVAVLPWRTRLPGRRILYIADRLAPDSQVHSPWLMTARDSSIVVRNLALSVWSARRLMAALEQFGGDSWRPNMRTLDVRDHRPDRTRP